LDSPFTAAGGLTNDRRLQEAGLSRTQKNLLLLARKLLRLPGLRRLQPAARRLLALARAPESPFHGGSAPGTAGSCNSVTIISANLWHDWPRHRRVLERAEDFASLVEAHSAEIILLQEVSRTRYLRLDEWLAQRLGMTYAYSRVNGHLESIGFEEGLAILSRYPLSAPILKPLGGGRNPLVRRLALGAVVASPCGPLFAVSVHLGLRRRHNIAQLACLRAWLARAADGLPALIGGDFNATEAAPHMARTRHIWLDTFRHLHPSADGTTHVLRWPWGATLRRSRLDYIFYQPGIAGWQVLEASSLTAPNRPHSDHKAVLARLAPI